LSTGPRNPILVDSVLPYCDIFLHSVSTLEDVSFVSAEESVADLRDFDELRQEENSFSET
jgi:hypothetical protein